MASLALSMPKIGLNVEWVRFARIAVLWDLHQSMKILKGSRHIRIDISKIFILKKLTVSGQERHIHILEIYIYKNKRNGTISSGRTIHGYNLSYRIMPRYLLSYRTMQGYLLSYRTIQEYLLSYGTI